MPTAGNYRLGVLTMMRWRITWRSVRRRALVNVAELTIIEENRPYRLGVGSRSQALYTLEAGRCPPERGVY